MLVSWNLISLSQWLWRKQYAKQPYSFLRLWNSRWVVRLGFIYSNGDSWGVRKACLLWLPASWKACYIIFFPTSSISHYEGRHWRFLLLFKWRTLLVYTMSSDKFFYPGCFHKKRLLLKRLQDITVCMQWRVSNPLWLTYNFYLKREKELGSTVAIKSRVPMLLLHFKCCWIIIRCS